jgi:hypothetical protein
VAYEIRVKGHLDRSWSEWFDGLTVDHSSDGTTTLTGPVADQAALYGLIDRARNLGLTLIAVQQVPLEERGHEPDSDYLIRRCILEQIGSTVNQVQRKPQIRDTQSLT